MFEDCRILLPLTSSVVSLQYIRPLVMSLSYGGIGSHFFICSKGLFFCPDALIGCEMKSIRCAVYSGWTEPSASLLSNLEHEIKSCPRELWEIEAAFFAHSVVLAVQGKDSEQTLCVRLAHQLQPWQIEKLSQSCRWLYIYAILIWCLWYYSSSATCIKLAIIWCQRVPRWL